LEANRDKEASIVIYTSNVEEAT